MKNAILIILCSFVYSVSFSQNYPSEPTKEDTLRIEKQLVTDTQALVDRFNLLMCAGQLSDATVQLIVNALKADKITPDSSDDLKQMHVGRALAFVMCGAEYLVQR